MKVMKWSVIALAVSAGTSQMALASQQSESKGFVEDASLDLLLRNTYYNRDYKDGADDVRSWGQGFITTFESGFTQGTIGVGVDAYGLLGVRLDGGRGYTYGAMFERDSNGDPERDLSQAGAAIKAQFSNTVIKYGNQFPSMPVLAYDDSRLLPESFTGTLITSNEIEGLELNAGRFTADSAMQTSSRDSVNYLGQTLKSIDVVGGTYAFNDNLSASLYYADNEDVAKKKYANINYVMPFADAQSLAFDFNIYDNKYDKQAFDETQDTTIWSLSAKYSVGSHAFILAHQRVTGDGNYEYNIGDGGGSIRRPCAHTGLYGLKPSPGFVARADGLPPLLGDFETIGVIARSPDDLGVVLSLAAHRHPADRASFAFSDEERSATSANRPQSEAFSLRPGERSGGIAGCATPWSGCLWRPS